MGRSRRRIVVVSVMAALLAAGAVRQALIELPATKRPVRASSIWPESASLATEQAMAAIGAEAARGGGVPPAARAMLHGVARAAPLSPDPYIVDGTIALAEGRPQARALFEAARLRNPRASAARYFLSDLYLREGHVEAGLAEMSALATLMPAAVAGLAPSIADFARQPGAVAALRPTFERSPALESATLTTLATDPDNADLVLALAGPGRRDPAAAPWEANMIATLIDAGRTAKARQLWATFSGEPQSVGVFHPDFLPSSAPPPFNWTLSPGPAGMVERHSGGGMDVVYYGREEAVLASQTLLLAPGTYLIAARNDPIENAGTLAWTLRCVPAGKMLGRVALAEESPGEASASVTVPAGCSAQALELRGSVGDLDQPVDLTLYSVRVVPGGGA